MRHMSRCENGHTAEQMYKWIVLDLDIDPEWIETLNTVLDDNKVLKLVSNECIPLSLAMWLLFQLSHLKNATPATVSRAGILFINENDKVVSRARMVYHLSGDDFHVLALLPPETLVLAHACADEDELVSRAHRPGLLPGRRRLPRNGAAVLRGDGEVYEIIIRPAASCDGMHAMRLTALDSFVSNNYLKNV